MPPAYGKQNNRIFTETGDGAIHMLVVVLSSIEDAFCISSDDAITSATKCSIVVLSGFSINVIAVM